jgi:starvation-inducible DNA-binding protein
MNSRGNIWRSTVSKAIIAPAELDTPSSLSAARVKAISGAINGICADAFALYLKTKNFHWHVSGRHFRDYHLILDELAEAIFWTADQLAERGRKIGGATIRSIGQVARLQTIEDNDDVFGAPLAMRRELMEGDEQVAVAMSEAHELCDEHDDVASARELRRRHRAPKLVPVRDVSTVWRQRRISVGMSTRG